MTPLDHSGRTPDPEPSFYDKGDDGISASGHGHDDHVERLRPILSTLWERRDQERLTSNEIRDELHHQGLSWSDRTLRLYLAELVDHGLAIRHGRRGYSLTESGAGTVQRWTVTRRLGAVLHQMEGISCRVGFDVATFDGPVSINACLVPTALARVFCDDLEAVYRAGLGVGSRILFVPPGGDLFGRTVPRDHIGLGTMCSLTIAGMCLRRGIPTHAQFGGLLQIDGHQPRHFLEMIRYEATSLSPNQLFIRSNLTSVTHAATRGNGVVTASFREVPTTMLPLLERLHRECMALGFPGFLIIGQPGKPVLNAPVHEGRVGLVLTTGLNPLACLWERQHRNGIDDRNLTLALDGSRPMTGTIPYASLIPVAEFRRCVANIAEHTV